MLTKSLLAEYNSLVHLTGVYSMVGFSSFRPKLTLVVENTTAQVWGSYTWWSESGIFQTTGIQLPPPEEEMRGNAGEMGVEYVPNPHRPRVYNFKYRARSRDGAVGLDERFTGSISVPHPEASNALLNGYFNGQARDGYWDAYRLDETEEENKTNMTLEAMKREWDAMGATNPDFVCPYEWANEHWMTISLEGTAKGQGQASQSQEHADQAPLVSESGPSITNDGKN